MKQEFMGWEGGYKDTHGNNIPLTRKTLRRLFKAMSKSTSCRISYSS